MRVERDGSIGWHYTTIGLAARDVGGLCRMVVEHQGGIVALVSDASLEADLRMIRITATGDLVHGAAGIDVAVQVGFDLANRNAWVAIASDGEGGLFVALLGDGGPFDGRATHLDADGDPIFGPVGIGAFTANSDVTEFYQVFPDGDGGIWVVQSGNAVGRVQHLDALGRPLFGERVGMCLSGGTRRDYFVYSHEDPDAGMSLDDASMSVDPDAGMDASPQDGG